MTFALELNAVAVAYGGRPVLEDVTLELPEGGVACLLGPSGCGKTSLLRAVAGFETLSGGEIRLAGTVVANRQTHLPAEERRVGMVFQDYALFPHLTVAENVRFGLSRWSSADAAARVQQLLELTGLTQFASRYPHQISGGQQQRVALARALAPRPALLLMDEPFASLDVELRETLAAEVRRILKLEGISALMVSHNQLEAFAFADHIGVLREGRLLQWARPYAIYHQPATRAVASFIGEGLLLPGRTLTGGVVTELGLLPGALPEGLAPGSAVDVLLRPDDLAHDDQSPLTATVESRCFRGAHFLYHLRLASGQPVLCLVASHHDHAPGDAIGIVPQVDHLVVFPREPG